MYRLLSFACVVTILAVVHPQEEQSSVEDEKGKAAPVVDEAVANHSHSEAAVDEAVTGGGTPDFLTRWECTVKVSTFSASAYFSCVKPTQSEAYDCAKDKAESWCQQQGASFCFVVEQGCEEVAGARVSARSLGAALMDCRMTCRTRTNGEVRTAIAPTRQQAWTDLLQLARTDGGVAPGSIRVHFQPRFIYRVTGTVYCEGKKPNEIYDIEVSGIETTGTRFKLAYDAARENADHVEEAAAMRGLSRKTTLSDTPTELVEPFEEAVVAVKATANDGFAIYVIRRAQTKKLALEQAKARAVEIATEHNGASAAPAEVSLSDVL